MINQLPPEFPTVMSQSEAVTANSDVTISALLKAAGATIAFVGAAATVARSRSVAGLAIATGLALAHASSRDFQVSDLLASDYEVVADDYAPNR